MSYYYDRQGNPLDLFEWARIMESEVNRHVALTLVDDVKISTIWLGLDHSFGHGPPLIFETMIFGMEDEEILEYQWRYPSEIAALAGHDQAVALVKEALAKRR